MEEDFETWKKKQIEDKFQYLMQYYKKNTELITDSLYHECCSCCGLALGQREYTKAVDVSVDSRPWNDLNTNHPLIKREQIKLESGEWLKMSFFIPDDCNYQEEYDYSQVVTASETNKLGQIQLAGLIGVSRDNFNAFIALYNNVKYLLNIDGKQFVKEYFNVLKGKQFICIEPKSYKKYYGYYDWIDKLGMTGLIERQYRSPWFHNSPYPPEEEEGLNYLQLQLCKVL